MYKNNILTKLNQSIFENLKKIELLNEEKREALKKLQDLEFRMSDTEKKIQDYRIISVKIQNLKEKVDRVKEIENLNQNLSAEISDLKMKKAISDRKIEDLKNFDLIFEQKQKLFDESMRSERIAEIKVAETKKEVEFFSKQISEMKEKIKKTEEMRKQVNYLSELENWLSKKFVPLVSVIEKNVMTKLKKEFSQLFSEWFSMLVSESFNAKIDENFTPIIEYQDYELDYSYLSGGERTAVALAYRLALNQVINSMLSKIKTKDIVILDEPTDGFSAQQLDKMRDVLNQLNVGQLIIVSHEQKIESFVDNVIRFKKTNGISAKET